MPQLSLKPTHKIVTNYYDALIESKQMSLLHEGAVAPHFAALLRTAAGTVGWNLQWLIDQYRVKTDKRSGITNDPNRRGDPEYIVRLIGQVITVSLETVSIVESLPSLAILETQFPKGKEVNS